MTYSVFYFYNITFYFMQYFTYKPTLKNHSVFFTLTNYLNIR